MAKAFSSKDLDPATHQKTCLYNSWARPLRLDWELGKGLTGQKGGEQTSDDSSSETLGGSTFLRSGYFHLKLRQHQTSTGSEEGSMATGHRINSRKCLSHQLSWGPPSRASYNNRYRGQMEGKDRLYSTPQGKTFPYSQGTLGREGQEGFHRQLWPTASSCLAQWAAHLQSKPVYCERADMLPIENSVVCTCALSARKRKKENESRETHPPQSRLQKDISTRNFTVSSLLQNFHEYACFLPIHKLLFVASFLMNSALELVF